MSANHGVIEANLSLSTRSSMRVRERAIRRIPKAQQILNLDAELLGIQGDLRTLLATVASDLIGPQGYTPPVREYLFPCSVTRWQGRLLVDAEDLTHGEPTDGQYQPRHKSAAADNGRRYRNRVEQLYRAARIVAVQTQRLGDANLSEHGTVYQ